jgi:nicotinamide-nucleotide amidase
MKIALLLTGNEIMTGDPVDSNSSMIAQTLAPNGIAIGRKVTLGDDFAALQNEIEALSKQWPVVIVNGGLGPTDDDLTAEALAAAANISIEENAVAAKHIETWCERRGFAANAANMKQALLPAGCEIIDNHRGSAVGFSVTLNDSLIMCTPGVPSELREMLNREIVPLLQSRYPQSNAIRPLRLKTFGLGESRLQQLVKDQLPDWPQEVDLGFRAGAPLLEIKLEISDARFEDKRQQCLADLQAMIGDSIVGPDDTTLAERVFNLLQQSQQQLTTAESCTGGLIAATVTSVAGASEVFEAGVVSYSNRIKSRVLNVAESTLETHGAVSEQVVREMAQGALALSDANLAIAVSGIAGPGGGSDEKPVGTVWIAWGSKDNLCARRFHLPFGRQMFQTMVTAIGLDLIRRRLLGISEDAEYYQRRPASN